MSHAGVLLPFLRVEVVPEEDELLRGEARLGGVDLDVTLVHTVEERVQVAQAVLPG